ncbi:benzoate-CoA ligase family protein [Minwuia thermotolerans]|uniref:2-aminobenzoate-CoA ligase n=1 Tax=Minwuia thermotolerans TaxID=2056226 RepID=A0A2M9G3U8_9PROT|nr:benzoate-CoA ligase family protein [Minwuia thermotolerans]PJK30383.1 2-aminobenzoate-CoA ligase [Minwuia thermotolerans]
MSAEPFQPTGRSAHVDSFARDRLPPRDQWPTVSFDGLPELRAYPGQINCGAALLDRAAERFPDRPAYLYRDRVWSYAELKARADRIAHVLVDDCGIRPGNRVLIRGANTPMFVAIWFAVMKAGAIAVATMPLLRARELVYIAGKAEVALALCDRRLEEDMAKAVAASDHLQRVVHFAGDLASEDELERAMAGKPESFAAADTAADDVCLIAFTSGTTGQPKGCMHFHRDVMAINDTFCRHVLRPDETDVFTGSPPIAFTFGLGALVTFPVSVGAATLLSEQFTPETTLQAIQDHRVTTLFSAPTAFRAMTALAADYDLSSLTRCVSAGETLPGPVWEGWRKATGVRIIDGLGSTEMLHIFIAERPENMRAGLTGRAIPGYEARVVGEDGRDCAPGEIGLLAVRGPTGVRYLDNPERQADYARGGWNFTGDSYAMEADGWFRYAARSDDMIISSGYNIAGPEVEAALLTHPDVAECAVVGAPDEERGQVVKAFVVLRRGVANGPATAKALQDHVKAEIAPYKYPRQVAFVDELPKTQTGKVQRFVLREGEEG